jgi:hypothetical protein
MTLEFGEAVKVIDEHIEILKQNLLFLMAERKPESTITQIITILKLAYCLQHFGRQRSIAR